MRIDGRYLWKASPNELLDQPFRRGQELKNLRTFWLIVLNVIFDGDNAQRAALGTADLRKPPMKLRAAIVHHDHRAAAAGEEIGDHADRLRIGQATPDHKGAGLRTAAVAANSVEMSAARDKP